jgi:hypothetical protein
MNWFVEKCCTSRLQNASLKLVKVPFHEGSGGSTVTATSKLTGQFIAVDMASRPEADFKSTPDLLDHDERYFCPFDGKG